MLCRLESGQHARERIRLKDAGGRYMIIQIFPMTYARLASSAGGLGQGTKSLPSLQGSSALVADSLRPALA